MKKQKIKVAAYARVSTNSKDQENSFEHQHKYFLDRAEKMENEELVAIYADKGITGTSLRRRDEFKRMLYDAGLDEKDIKNSKNKVYEASDREPKFNKIYVRNTSRFARNVDIILILRELLKKGVYVHFLDIDLLFDSQDKEFTLNLFLNFAQQESIDRSKKVRDGNEVTAKLGTIRIGGLGIYGYNYNSETKELTIIEEEAEIIRLIYELYLDGLGFRRIINYLYEHGHRPRGGKDKFSISTIKRILRNEKYYGANVRNKYDSGTVLQKKSYAKLKPEDEWIVHEGAIPPIIDKETFEKVQEIWTSKLHHTKQYGIYKGTTEFAGMIKCFKCGGNYVRDIDRGRVFFKCSTKKNSGYAACDSYNFNLADLEEAMFYFSQQGLSEQIDHLKREFEKMLLDTKRILTDKIDKQQSEEALKIKEQIDQNEEKKKRLLSLYMDGTYDKDMLDEMIQELNTEGDTLQATYAELTMPNDEIEKELSSIDRLLVQLGDFKVEPRYERDDFIELIDEVVVVSAHNIEDDSVKNTPVVMLQFYFKPFKGIGDIVSKYIDEEDAKTIKSISWEIQKRRA